ncbi:MAG: hypothetical protein P1V81_04885 [Planctomycetota bacterium]|nr:hypothetical protein [Planctomycetota bacterium]
MDSWLILVAIIAVNLVLLVFWIKMLVDAARKESWGWFVVMLIFGIAAVPYFFIEYGRTVRGGSRSR